MVRARKAPYAVNLGGGHGIAFNQEYKSTLHGKLVPVNDKSPVYSKETKREIKRLLQEEKEYIESMSGPVKRYKISDIQGRNRHVQPKSK
ncbi:hypothetical protein [Paenibacillus apiarius]|uniref:hypothetical protein n=1 Tax=Paenibacillus apiarius TaxID=46240 RepID=UPI003B3A991F